MLDLLSIRRCRASSYSDFKFCDDCSVAHADTPFHHINDDIILHLFSFLSFQDIARLRSTSIFLVLKVSQVLFNQCGRLFQSFYVHEEDVCSFFDLLEYRHSIIVGFTPLRIMHPRLPLPDQLVILTAGPPGPFGADLVDTFGYTLVEEGYSVVKVCDELGFRFFGEHSPHFARLESRGDNGRGPKKEILLVGTCEYSIPAVGVLTEFPTTLLMNFIAGDGYYSLYPKLTSAGKGYLNIPLDIDPDDIAIPAIEHLKSQHFEVVSDPARVIGSDTHRCGVDASCPATPRLFPGPPMFRADFQYFRRCATSLPSVFFTLRSKSACGTALGPFRDRVWDDNGTHVSRGKEIGTGLGRGIPAALEWYTRPSMEMVDRLTEGKRGEKYSCEPATVRVRSCRVGLGAFLFHPPPPADTPHIALSELEELANTWVFPNPLVLHGVPHTGIPVWTPGLDYLGRLDRLDKLDSAISAFSSVSIPQDWRPLISCNPDLYAMSDLLFVLTVMGSSSKSHLLKDALYEWIRAYPPTLPEGVLHAHGRDRDTQSTEPSLQIWQIASPPSSSSLLPTPVAPLNLKWLSPPSTVIPDVVACFAYSTPTEAPRDFPIGALHKVLFLVYPLDPTRVAMTDGTSVTFANYPLFNSAFPDTGGLECRLSLTTCLRPAPLEGAEFVDAEGKRRDELKEPDMGLGR
ncbi:hypothetical protein NMY22_g10520 [Coprinellus aureogranulatus]|nr:hypothetical protein NMY22_g10520 [Coprinellus aureogranulatus]